MAIALTPTTGLSREEWLAYRRLGIGGSDASIVCGVNKYKTPVELWMDKTGELPAQEAGEAAYWGTTLESIVRDEFTKRTGIKVIPVNYILQSSEYPFMLANLDGVLMCPTHGKCVFEAKTASAFKAGEWEDDAVPYEYILQTQHCCAVTRYAGAYIAVLIGGNTFKWKFIKRDEEIISMLIRRERDFWNHVQDGVPPCLDGSEAASVFLSKRFPESTSQSKIELPACAAELIHQYNDACEQLEIVTEQKRKATNLLKQMLGSNEAGTVGDSTITWKNVQQERFDSTAFKAEQASLYAKYSNKTTHRRFLIKTAS
jgi:putative phage-type endonuclease